jgi:hypothetical protein
VAPGQPDHNLISNRYQIMTKEAACPPQAQA